MQRYIKSYPKHDLQLIRTSLFKSSTGVELLSSEEKDMDIGNKFSKDLNIFLSWFSSKHEDK